MSKKTNKMSKRERNEHLTNWYMINLSWGVVGILALTLLYRLYRTPDFLMIAQPLMWILTGVFAVGAIALFTLGKCQVIKNTIRANHYAIFIGVCALVTLWLALYNNIRPVLESLVQTIFRNPNLIVTSYWNVWLPMIGIGIYLVAAFIRFAAKVIRK